MATQVLVSWTYGLSDNTGFLLQRSVDSGSTWPNNYPTDAVTHQYTDNDVVIGGTYWYHVAATNPYGTGSFSNTASVYVSSSGVFPVGIPALAARLPFSSAGYKICGWSSALSQMTTASCSSSLYPEWNGVFDQMITTIPGFPGDPFPTPYPVWYFTGSSINGNSISADGTPDWPSGDWQALDNTTRLFWFLDGKWHLEIACSNAGGAVWWVGSGDSTDINNPSGTYTTPDTNFGSFLSTLPTTIVVKAVSDVC